MLRALILLPALVTLAAGQSGSGAPSNPLPVREVTRRPDITELDMSFGFQEPGIYHALTVHFARIDGQPTRGVRYGVDASFSGLDAVRSLWFEMVDERDGFMERVPMVPDDTTPLDSGQFVGMLTVPSETFRIVVRGITHTGLRFHGGDRQLFRPVRTPPRSPLEGMDSMPLPAAQRDLLRKELEARLTEAVAARERRVAANPDGTITVPQTRVTAVEYAPYLSPSGRLLGLTITYSIEVEPGGRYNPSLRVVPEDPASGGAGRDAMRPLSASITPRPHLYYEPEHEADEIPGLLLSDALYQSGTRYRFAVQLVPGFVALRQDRVTRCLTLTHLKSRYHGDVRYLQMIANRGPSTYRVYIGRNAFEGRIDGFAGEGSLYQNWVDEGTLPCPEPQAPRP
ncbi:MAG TPA: hypothetical protein VGD94_20175 [Vicinamibacterales bacterium]